MSANPKAFPVGSTSGMDLRDYFAAKALPVASSGLDTGRLQMLHGESISESLAACAYLIADAMLAERSKAK